MNFIYFHTYIYNFFYPVHIYTCKYCLFLRRLPRLLVRVISINAVFGSPYSINLGANFVPYAFDKFDNKIFKVSAEKSFEDAVVLFIN